MIILEAISTTQEIDVYVREHNGIQYMVIIRDEENFESSTDITQGSYADGILTINVDYDFKEGRFYLLQIFSLAGGSEYEQQVIRIQKDDGTLEAQGCLSYAIAELMAFDAEYLLTFQKIYVTDQTEFDTYSPIEGYYTQPTKTTDYIIKS